VHTVDVISFDIASGTQTWSLEGQVLAVVSPSTWTYEFKVTVGGVATFYEGTVTSDWTSTTASVRLSIQLASAGDSIVLRNRTIQPVDSPGGFA
jgi:hypothetical protein